MTHFNITVSKELFQQLFSQDGKDKGMATLLESMLNQVLQAQASEQLKAEPYERTEEREAYRNGSYIRNMVTRVGSVKLSIPRILGDKFSTLLFKRYQRSEQALIATMMEMVVNGVSTRKVTNITQELCGTEFSKSTVSEICKNLDPIVTAWNNRSLREEKFHFLSVDAIYIKVRENGRVLSRAMLVATGVSEDGNRQILGIQIGDSESEASWGEFFGWLKNRGLTGVDVVTSDSHGGLVKAFQKHFQGKNWQRCQSHFMKNILDATPKALKAEIKQHVRNLFDAPDKETARFYLEQTTSCFSAKASKAMDILERGMEDATTVLLLPEKYRKRMRTTNPLERLNSEIRRRENVIRIFPNRESAIRILEAYLMEQNDNWDTGRKYLDMEEYVNWRKEEHNALNTNVARVKFS